MKPHDWCKVFWFNMLSSREDESFSVMKWRRWWFHGHLSNIAVKATKTKSSYFPVGFIRFVILLSFQRCVTCLMNRHYTTCEWVKGYLTIKVSWAEWSRTQTSIYHFQLVSVSLLFLAFLDQHIWGCCSLSAQVWLSHTLYFLFKTNTVYSISNSKRGPQSTAQKV